MNRTSLYVGLIFFLISLPLVAQSPMSRAYVRAEIANDVFFLPLKTDRYFTSGIELELGWVHTSPLLRGAVANTTHYWRVNHNLYTPTAIDSIQIQPNDRPFASYLTLTRGKRYQNTALGLSLEQSWTLGILGKYSGGGMMQNAFHDIVDYADPIPGWTHEVKPDLIVNYRFRIGQRFPLSRRMSVRPVADLRLGTLYTDAAGGMEIDWTVLRLGANRALRLQLASTTRLVGYNATLTGGLLNRDERYRKVIEPNRLVGQLRISGDVQFNRWNLSGGFVHLGAEFAGGWPHTWAWFGVQYGWGGRSATQSFP